MKMKYVIFFFLFFYILNALIIKQGHKTSFLHLIIMMARLPSVYCRESS